jgi:hypothetical protein
MKEVGSVSLDFRKRINNIEEIGSQIEKWGQLRKRNEKTSIKVWREKKKKEGRRNRERDDLRTPKGSESI